MKEINEVISSVVKQILLGEMNDISLPNKTIDDLKGNTITNSTNSQNSWILNPSFDISNSGIKSVGDISNLTNEELTQLGSDFFQQTSKGTVSSSAAGGLSISEVSPDGTPRAMNRADEEAESNSVSATTQTGGDIYSTITANSDKKLKAGIKNSDDPLKNIEEMGGGKTFLDSIVNFGNELSSKQLEDTLKQYGEYIPAESSVGTLLTGIVGIVGNNLKKYQDGVSETSYGSYLADSWAGNSNSFLNYFSKSSAKGKKTLKINVLESTPLDPGSEKQSLFGSLILGCPFLYNEIDDPGNRTLINTLIKDSRYLSLTPGMPKYHGTQVLQALGNNAFNQTQNGGEMLSYLLRNGLDDSFSSKDKRYYTFESKYKEYFAYLEAMLNPIWLKMGLGTSQEENTFNIFSFFNIKNNSSIDPSRSEELIPRYNSSIGFYCNPSGAVSESVSSSPTGFGSQLSGEVNAASDAHQQINYITGMGTGSGFQNANRKIANTINAAKQIGSWVGSNFQTTASLMNSGWKWGNEIKGTLTGLAMGALGAVAGAALDINRISTTQDFGAVMQSFATANGMKVVYPELWADSSYSKSVNFQCSFVSPYGDPLSIFKYVYVPFCALLCFALPRQAAENGYVSPFFVRADVPGVVTSDLALISDISWVKGGVGNLWTKDGLPRAIDVSFSVHDLYPYLAMTKRMSFLSANPSYTVFLDNMAGMCKLAHEDNDTDNLNIYFNELINRVNGVRSGGSGNGLWNTFAKNKRSSNAMASKDVRVSATNRVDGYSIPWLHNSTL